MSMTCDSNALLSLSLFLVIKKEKKKKIKVHREKAANGLPLQEPKPKSI